MVTEHSAAQRDNQTPRGAAVRYIDSHAATPSVEATSLERSTRGVPPIASAATRCSDGLSDSVPWLIALRTTSARSLIATAIRIRLHPLPVPLAISPLSLIRVNFQFGMVS